MGGFVGDLLGTSAPRTKGAAGATAQITDLEERMYEEGKLRGEPFYELGTGAAGALQGLLGGIPTRRFADQDFTQDPSYQFRVGEGEKALQRQLAAQGKTMSPEAVKALQAYGQEAGSQEYGRAFDRYRAEEGDMFNRLFNLSNIGQGQAAQTTQAGQTMSGRVGETLASFGGIEDAARNQATQARSSMFKNAMMGGLMSDERLKENIEFVREENGHKIYHFDYKDQDGRFEGVMAQEVKEINPDAIVTREDGMMAVRYDVLGLEMREVV
jgi:hypothetical protein